jgi:hypothetical protein
MPNPIAKCLAELPSLGKAKLGELWKELFQTSAPPQLRTDFMIPILAYRIQEKAFGCLGTSTRNRLRQLSKAFENHGLVPIASSPQIKPGTRLVREWRDEVHLVNVGTNYYEYKGGKYKSLSQIARLITGTRWSGPLFFGINGDRLNKGAGKEVQ